MESAVPTSIYRVATHLVNLETLGNLKVVKEFDGDWRMVTLYIVLHADAAAGGSIDRGGLQS